MKDEQWAWRKGARVRHRDGRTGTVVRDVKPGSTVHVKLDAGGSSFLRASTLTEIDEQGQEVRR